MNSGAQGKQGTVDSRQGSMK